MKAADKKPRSLVPAWDLVPKSWQLLVRYFEPVIFLFILPSMLLILGGLLLGDSPQLQHFGGLSHKQLAGLAAIGLSILWSVINFAPSLYFRVQVVTGKKVGLLACYRQGLSFFWRLIGLNILLGMAVIAGLLLFIVPGLVLIYVFIKRYYLVEYYMVDRNLSIKQALSASHHETSPYLGSIWGVIGVQFVFSISAGLVSAMGKVGSVPAIFIQLICLFLPALRYKEIKSAQRSASL